VSFQYLVTQALPKGFIEDSNQLKSEEPLKAGQDHPAFFQ
jgi:hypothetical protein